MVDGAQVQTKSQVALASSRDITTTIVENPTSSDVANYTTALDPAVIAGKDNALEITAVDLANEPIPLWYSDYGTGLNEAEILYKTTLFSNGVQIVITGDQPYVADIGPTVDLPPLENPPSLDDEWHKVVVTDLIPTNTLIASDAFPPSNLSMDSEDFIRRAQYMLFPVSSRHICKTSDGVLHAVISYSIDGLSRIIHLVSENGGATWISTVVDNDDGRDYVLPSITCDASDCIHITFSRWMFDISFTYWLYCGSSVPPGFTDLSYFSIAGSGEAYNRLLGGGVGTINSYNAGHEHDYVLSGGSPSSCHSIGGAGSSPSINHHSCMWHHSYLEANLAFDIALPPSLTLRLLRYNGFPPNLPVDIIVLFDTPSLPTGYSRYSAQDGKFIYCSNSVGSPVGADTHRHSPTVSCWGSNGIPITPGSGSHTTSGQHTGTFVDDLASSIPPGHTVILGRITEQQTIIPQHSILMTDSIGVVDGDIDYTPISGPGDELSDVYLIGGTTYEPVVGSLTHNHGSGSFTTDADLYTVAVNSGSVYNAASYGHTHSLSISCIAAENAFPAIFPQMYHIDSLYNLSAIGNDVFYLRIDSSGDSDPVINITNYIDGIYHSMKCTCLCDLSGDVHFMWISRGLNTNPSYPRLCYKKMTNGVLGSIEYPGGSNVNCGYPSFDIAPDGSVHVVYSIISSTSPRIEYTYKSSPSWLWHSVQHIDSSLYVGFPSNLVIDSLSNIYVQYCKWSDNSTKIADVYYVKKTSGGSWGTPVNLSPGKSTNSYHQFPGQTYIDNKGNVVFTFSGKGYGAHATVYHPVYRYLTPSGDVIPSLSSDAEDVFPDDDSEIIFPTVFWHSNPLISSVYHNLPIAGMTFIYLHNVRGVGYDVADIKFYSSPNALVGDVGSSGQGGSGEGDFSPGGVGAATLLQFESFRTTVRGYIGKTSFVNDWGGYVV